MEKFKHLKRESERGIKYRENKEAVKKIEKKKKLKKKREENNEAVEKRKESIPLKTVKLILYEIWH